MYSIFIKKIKNNEKYVFHYVKPNKPTVIWNRFPKLEQHTRGKWMVHGTKHPQANQLQSSAEQMAERSPQFM